VCVPDQPDDHRDIGNVPNDVRGRHEVANRAADVPVGDVR
jgi:hypothetical protein